MLKFFLSLSGSNRHETYAMHAMLPPFLPKSSRHQTHTCALRNNYTPVDAVRSDASGQLQTQKVLLAYVKLAPLNLLASCSLSEPEPRPELGCRDEGEGRLGGRSPLSCNIASSVAQPGCSSKWNPSARSCVRATLQSIASSS